MSGSSIYKRCALALHEGKPAAPCHPNELRRLQPHPPPIVFFFHCFVCLSVCLSACLPACLPVCLSACLPACLSLSLYISLSLFISLYLPAFLPLYLPAFPPLFFRLSSCFSSSYSIIISRYLLIPLSLFTFSSPSFCLCVPFPSLSFTLIISLLFCHFVCLLGLYVCISIYLFLSLYCLTPFPLSHCSLTAKDLNTTSIGCCACFRNFAWPDMRPHFPNLLNY